MIFLKSPKTLLGKFWLVLVIFAWWGIFPKHLAVTHNYLGPLHYAKFQKKLMSQFWKNLQADERMDEQTLIYRTLPD